MMKHIHCFSTLLCFLIPFPPLNAVSALNLLEGNANWYFSDVSPQSEPQDEVYTFLN